MNLQPVPDPEDLLRAARSAFTANRLDVYEYLERVEAIGLPWFPLAAAESIEALGCPQAPGGRGARIRSFEAEGVPVDSYGVGSSLIRGANGPAAHAVPAPGPLTGQPRRRLAP